MDLKEKTNSLMMEFYNFRVADIYLLSEIFKKSKKKNKSFYL